MNMLIGLFMYLNLYFNYLVYSAVQYYFITKYLFCVILQVVSKVILIKILVIKLKINIQIVDNCSLRHKNDLSRSSILKN